MGFKCYPITDPNASWNYCPSFGAAILFCVLFGLVTITHLAQAIVYRKPFASVLVMGAAWELVGYIFRALSVTQQLNSTYALVQLLLILLAPLWINAFVYMVLGRALHYFLEDDRVFKVKARKITFIFVLFDITAFIIQALGGSLTNNSNPVHTQQLGLHIYMGGVGLQLFFIAIFIVLAVRFQQKVTRLMDPQVYTQTFAGRIIKLFTRLKTKTTKFSDHTYSSNEAATSYQNHKNPSHALKLLHTVYGVLLLIIFRNIYRLIEFSAGVLSKITTHEWYAYVFDALPMLAAFILLACFHPGQILRGPRANFSEENQAIKEEKKQKKEEKQQGKDEKRRQKLLAKLGRKEAV